MNKLLFKKFLTKVFYYDKVSYSAIIFIGIKMLSIFRKIYVKIMASFIYPNNIYYPFFRKGHGYNNNYFLYDSNNSISPLFYVGLKRKKILLENDPNLNINPHSIKENKCKYIYSNYNNFSYKENDYDGTKILLSPICFVKNKDELSWYLDNGVDPKKVCLILEYRFLLPSELKWKDLMEKHYSDKLSLFYIVFSKSLHWWNKSRNNMNKKNIKEYYKKIEILQELLNRNIFCDLKDKDFLTLLFLINKNETFLNMILKYIYLHHIEYVPSIIQYIEENVRDIEQVKLISRYFRIPNPRNDFFQNIKNIGHENDRDKLDKCYLEQMIKINHWDELFLAVYNNDIGKVKEILKTGNYKTIDSLGYNLYHYCYNVEILKLLFKEKLDLPLQGKDYPLNRSFFELESIHRKVKIIYTKINEDFKLTQPNVL